MKSIVRFCSRALAVDSLSSQLKLTWRDCAMVGLFALAIATVWSIFVPIAFYTDSWGYFQYARLLARDPAGGLPSHRTPGFPLLMLMTGVTRWNSLSGLLAAQFLMAVAIPILGYLTFQPFNRRAALVSGFLISLTLIPFVYQKWVMTEQVYLFLTIAIGFLVSRLFIAGARGELFIGVAILCAALALVKPQGALVFWFTALICAVTARHLRRWVVGGAVFFISLMLLWAVADRYKLQHAGAFPEIFGPSSPAEQRLAELYFEPWRRCLDSGPPCRPVIRPEAGPASAELYRIASESLKDAPPYWETRTVLTPPSMFDDLIGAPGVFVSSVWQRPHFAYWQFINAVVERRLGQRGRDQLFARVAAEYSNIGMAGFVRFLMDNPKSLLLGGAPRATGYNLFWQVYGPGRNLRTLDTYRPTRLINPENGPASRVFFGELRRYLVAFPSLWETMYPEFSGRADALVSEMFERPRFTHLWRFWNMLANQIGFANADALFSAVAKEAIARHPESVILFWDNLATAAFGPEANSDDGYRLISLPHIGQTQYVPDEMPGRLRKELLATNVGLGPLPGIFDFLYQAAHVLKPTYFLLVVLSFSALWRSPVRSLAVWTLTVSLLQIATLSVFGSPSARYMDMVLLLPLMLAVVGCARLKSAPN